MSNVNSYHIFSLPQELLETLVPRNLIYDQHAGTSEDTETTDGLVPQSEGQRACNICLGISFADVNDQRSHFRSDWHRYNVKSRLNGGKAVTEVDFASLIEGTYMRSF